MGDLIISGAATVLLLSSSGSAADRRALDAEVFGESVLNDAVAIVLFNTFLNFYESQNVYVMTTLSVVVFTTLVCGGLTEPLLTYTQLKREGEDSHQGAYDEKEEYGLLHENVDERYLKPIFGGKSEHVSSA
ncbi:hypothetical protein P43SY_008816 [Pythium insidiosum]|uniref:Cation/H+ exchanger domain-containing protein n=1 Tax=Pythium insidiosum TaxID=114742 RepID=A0AAD5LIG0_PYTIN|nr:hypothetical protein P43SY_008816 [Pythium insidiosum]